MNCIQASLRLPIKCPFLQMSFPREKNAPSFVPDVSIKIDDENNITLQNTVDDNSKKIEDGFNLDSSTVFNFNKHKEG